MYYVVGLGRSGQAAAQWLHKNELPFIVWDDSEDQQNQAKLAGWTVTSPTTINWKAIHSVIISPGLALFGNAPYIAVQLANKYHIPIRGDMELFYHAAQHTLAKIIGITGTNGKSTTHAMIDHYCTSANIKCFSGGNNGIPILKVQTPLSQYSVFNIEMSSYQLDTLHMMRFDVGIILNITPDHLDRYDSVDAYVQSKKRQLLFVKNNGLKILGVDTPLDQQLYTEMLAEGHDDIIPISVTRPLDNGVYLENTSVIRSIGSNRVKICDIPHSIRGNHNVQNFIAALLVGEHLGISIDKIIDFTHTFKGLEHRQECVLDTPKALFINDSKATNAEATRPALETFKHIYWIAGGIAKEEGLLPLIDKLNSIEKVLLIGSSSERFTSELSEISDKIQSVDSMENAIMYIKNRLPTLTHKITVLLSPACASQDQFKDFVHRGNWFKELVKQHFGEK